MAIGYDKNVDYQAKINDAIAKGDTKAAMEFEVQRNAKINDMNSAGTNTGNYEKSYNYKGEDAYGLYDAADAISTIKAPKQVQPQNAYPTFNSKYQSGIDDIVSALQTYQQANSMGRDEANARAYSQLNQVYDAGLDKTLNNYNKNAVSRGMFGQLPIEALKQNAISESELNKSIAVNDLANNIYTQDYNMARQKDQDFYNKQNALLGVLGQGFNMDNTAYNNEVNAFMGQYNINNQEQQKWVDNIGQFSNDYQAQINKLKNDNDSSNDWQIGYLNNARNQKIAGINAAETEAQAAQYNQAMDMFDMLGYASGWVADALGVPEGTNTADYANMLADNARANAAAARSSSGGSSKSSTSKTSGTNTDLGLEIDEVTRRGLMNQAIDMAIEDGNTSQANINKWYNELVNVYSGVYQMDTIANQGASINQALIGSNYRYQNPGGFLIRNEILK